MSHPASTRITRAVYNYRDATITAEVLPPELQPSTPLYALVLRANGRRTTAILTRGELLKLARTLNEMAAL